jgi:type IV secretion/conjugal transfer VirB4 family ATPase
MLLDSIKRQRQRELKGKGAMNQVIAPCAFVNPNTLMTKRGDIFRVLKLTGMDAECMTPEQIEGICNRFDGALRILDPQHRVLQYLIKRDSPEISDPTTKNRLDVSRRSWLKGRAQDQYTVSLYLVVMRMRPLVERTKADLIMSFSTTSALRVMRSELKRETEQLDASVNSLIVQLEATIKPVALDGRETMRFLRSLVNLSPYKQEPHGYIPTWHVDQHLAASDLHCFADHLRQDDYTMRFVSLCEPPSSTFPHMLRDLLAIPGNMILCSEWKRESNLLVTRHITQQRGHFHSAKIAWKQWWFKSKTPLAAEIDVDESKKDVVDELGHASSEMQMKGNFFGRFSLTCALFHSDPTVVRTAVSKALEVFGTHDARAIEEKYNGANAWASMIPGNYPYNFRQMWLTNKNYADCSFLFVPSEGERHNRHLGKPALSILESVYKTPYYLNLHFQDVAHTVILGSMGSGKSFLLNSLINDYQQYGPYTVIYDLGGSYKRLTKEYGGSYMHIGKDTDVRINPFRLPPTAENLDFLFAFVRVLIERGNATMTPAQRKDLALCIADLYTLDEEVRTLGTLAQTCERSYANRLHEWVGEGRLAQYFDHVEDNLTISRFQTFDFEGMDRQEILEPLLFYILHRSNVNIYDPAQHATPKLIVFDEAWKFFKNPITQSYIHEGAKTWRKRNAAMVLATQSADDLKTSGLLPTIAENCFTRMFLANPGMDSLDYRELFNLNATEAEQIARLIPKQQFLLKQPQGSKVLNLFTDPESYRVFANKEITQ